jgi:hypothetical protein
LFHNYLPHKFCTHKIRNYKKIYNPKLDSQYVSLNIQ